MKKLKLGLIVGITAVLSIVSFNFTDGYFEHSKNIDIFTTLYGKLNIYYVDDTQPGKLMKTGIDAMLKSLDPYTVYYPESDIEDYRFMTTGQYGGIGSLITKKDSFVVISEPYEGFAAHKGGLIAGDVIIEVDGKSTLNKTTSELSKILKGEPGTSLTMKIKRPGTEEILIKEIVREEVTLDAVPYFGMMDNNVGYIKLNTFTETASRDVKAAFNTLKDSLGMETLVFDLRGNGGGLLNEAVEIVNIFIEKGQEVVTTKGKITDWNKIYNTRNTPLDTKIPLIVLIDPYSASASEIVAGTLQDLDRAVIIGQNSFGKGLVQQTMPLSYNSKLKVTVAKYYTPSGRCIQRLDYADKDEKGKAKKVADSLITQYETKNGRPVFDGEGITPDLEIEVADSPQIIGSLFRNTVFFDYATKYRLDHETIVLAKKFSLSIEEYAAFVEYTKSIDFEHETQTEHILVGLKEVAELEKCTEATMKQIEELEKQLATEKDNDIIKHEKILELILRNEIVSRYYYQTGRIEAKLADDNEMKKAVEVLANMQLYDSILAGTSESKED
ncbi:MAG: S41 family peptidase [Flavobacteriales bacterium]|nr:S41 family peptidase [Flavobacteriales bacterium]